MDRLDNKGYRVQQDRLDRTAVMAHKEKTATLALRVTEERRENPVNGDSLEYQDQLASQESPATLD